VILISFNGVECSTRGSLVILAKCCVSLLFDRADRA